MIRVCEKKLQDLEKELSLRLKVELHELQERKNAHINDMMSGHGMAFNEMKEYYNDITRENLDIIQTLTDKIRDTKEAIMEAETISQNIKENMEQLRGPLKHMEAKAAELRGITKHLD